MPLEISVVTSEQYDDITERFVYEKKQVLLEHSLYTISKWEEKWKKPFLVKDSKMTPEEMMDYIRCMVVREEDFPFIEVLSKKNILKIGEYINDKATATTVKKSGKPSRNSIITSEVIYSKMVLMGIPLEVEHWHLNRLLTLLQVIDAKASPKKMTKREIMERNMRENKRRKAALGIKE